MRSLTLSIAIAALAMPASAQMAPSAPGDIAAAVGDCWQAVSANAVDEQGLKAKGWAPGSMRTPDGQSVPAAMTIYGKKGTNAIIMLATSVDPRGCMVMSRVQALGDIGVTAQTVLKHLQALDPKVEGKRSAPSEIAYFSLPKAAILRATGSREQPSTVIQVSYTAPEKK